MGSPLGPVLAKILMCDFQVMNAKISPSFWNRYVDDTTMFHSEDSANE